MLTAISAVIGFLGSIVPAILKMFQQRQDNKHELAMMEAQVNAQKILGQQRLEEVGIKADVDEALAVLESAKPITTGVKWADAFVSIYNSSVRPTVTYAFFIMYALVKYSNYQSMKSFYSNLTWYAVVDKMWTEADMAIFCTIISFWFGSRAMGKFFKMK